MTAEFDATRVEAGARAWNATESRVTGLVDLLMTQHNLRRSQAVALIVQAAENLGRIDDSYMTDEEERSYK